MKKYILILSIVLGWTTASTAQQFTELSSFSSGVNYGDVEWGDYDKDTYMDVAVTGSVNGPYTRIFRNNGNSTFETKTEIKIPNAWASTVNWGDYDNDGDLDMLHTGRNNTALITPRIYRNDGNSNFTEQTQIQLTPIMYGDVSWNDYDNDGDLDILFIGKINVNTEQAVSKIIPQQWRQQFYRTHTNTVSDSNVQLFGMGRLRQR